MLRPLFVCLAATLAAPAGAAEAESTIAETRLLEERDGGDDERDGSSSVRLDQIQVTASRRPERDLEVTTAVSIVDAEQVRLQNPLTVADYLRGQPGAFVQATTPGQAIPIVRGLKGSEVLHMVDGFRLNTAFFRNSPNQYFALVDTQNVERVELARGPSSTLYGSDAMGGVVQVLTPEERFDGASWGARGHVRAQWSSADLNRIARVSGAAGRDGFSIAGGVTRQSVGERTIGGDQTIPFTNFDAHGGDVKMIWRVADGHELTVSGQYFKQPSTPRVDELVPGFGQTRPTSVEFYFEPNDRRFAQARYRVSAPTVWFDHADVQFGYQDINDDRRTRETGTNNREMERNRDQLRGVSAVFDKQVGRHGFSYGVEAYWDEVSSFRQRVNAVSGAITARPSRFPDGSTMDSFAVYLDDRIELAPRWTLNVGGRYSRFEIDLPANAAGTGAHLEPDDFTGNVGLGFEVSDGVHLVTNVGRGFRAPNVFDLGVFGDRPSNRFAIPNADLKPETVLTWDAGVKVARDGFAGEAFVWRSSYTDKITTVDTGVVYDNGRIEVQNRNVTDLDLWGVEIGARWTFDRSEVYGSLNYTRGDEEYAGQRYAADRVPPLSGRLGYRQRFGDGWSFDAYAQTAARQDRLSPRDVTDPRVDPNGTGGWSTLNARLGWEFHPGAELMVRGDNLTDRRYREHGSGVDEVGRSVTVGLDWRW